MDWLTHEKNYRQKNIQGLFNKKILVAGCGAIGSNLAINLARQGFSNFILVDFDRVEYNNLSTQAYFNQDIDRLKVQSLSSILHEISDDIDIETHHFKLDNNSRTMSVLKKADIIIDCFDNTESRQLLKDYGKTSKTPTLHGGLYEDYAETFWNDKYIVPQVSNGIDICEYPLARNIILLLVSVMSEEIIKFCLEQKRSNWCITLKDFKISKG